MKGVSKIVTNPTNSLIAISDIDGQIYVWDIGREEKACQFESTDELGGKRIVMTNNGEFIVTGSYSNNGLALYNSRSGNLIWKQQQITKIQTIKISPNDKYIYSSIDDKYLLQTDIFTGTPLNKFNGSEDIFFSIYNDTYILESKKYTLYSKNKEIKKIEKKSFACLDIGFASSMAFISEVAGSIRAISLTAGSEVWHHKPNEGAHFLGVQYNNTLDILFAILWSFEKGGEPVLYVFEATTGKILNKKILERSSTQHFDPHGKILISGSGNMLIVYDIESNIYDIKNNKIQLN